MNIRGGDSVVFNGILVAKFKLHPHKKVNFIKCPASFRPVVFETIDRYIMATQALAILSNLTTANWNAKPKIIGT